MTYAEADACAVAQLLTRPEGGGLPAQNVKVLLGAEATLTAISAEVTALLRKAARPGSVGIVYFAGHGAPDVDGSGAVRSTFLVPYDGRPDALGETGYAMKRLADRLEDAPGGQIVALLDACFTGGGRSVAPRGARAILPKDLLARAKVSVARRDRAIFAAAGPAERAYDDPARGHGLFTGVLLEALAGDADRDGDGRVTLSEAASFVTPRVRADSPALGGTQGPVLTGQASDLVLSSPGRR